tara:strand:+ start:11114 stop:11530 length:417 start_codon:yes stop_codon:yes gene_type:complete
LLYQDLKKARIAAGMTMEVVAKRLGIAQSTLSRIETGDTGVTSQRLADLCAVYGVKPSTLLDAAAVNSMSDRELDRIGAVIEFVEQVLADVVPRPAPSQIRKTVLAIFRQETISTATTGSEFDPTRYHDLIKILTTKE